MVFAVDTVLLRLTGDSLIPSPDSAVDSTIVRRRQGKSRMPELKNRSEIARALERYYPPDMRDAGLGGETLVQFHIDEQGDVEHRSVVVSSGWCRLDAAALLASELMRFRPALGDDGQPVPVLVDVPISFSSR